MNWGDVDVSVNDGTSIQEYFDWSVEAASILPNSLIFINPSDPDFDFTFTDADFAYAAVSYQPLSDVIFQFAQDGNTVFDGSSAGDLFNSVQYAPKSNIDGVLGVLDAAVPLPAGLPLLAAGLAGLAIVRRRRSANAGTPQAAIPA